MRKRLCIALILTLAVSMSSFLLVSAASKAPSKPGQPSVKKSSTTTWDKYDKRNVAATKITWTGKTVKGATGYEYECGDSLWSKGRGRTFTVTVGQSAKHTRTVSFRTRAYKTVGKKKYYSAWSSWSKVTLPKHKNGYKQPRG